MTRFDDQHVIITGASSGMGEATARLIAARGGKVSLLARRRDRLDRIAKDIDGRSGQATGFVADVSDQSGLTSALDAAMSAHGPCDGLFLNAGTGGRFAPIGNYEDETFDAVLRTNLYGPFWALRHMLPLMAARGSGSILITGSLASQRGMANNIAYVASKHAVLGMTRAAALEGAPSGVRVNCLIPGFIDTPMMAELPPDARDTIGAAVPQGRMGTSEEMAETAAFLLSDAASHITAQALSVDGGVLGTLKV